MALRIGVVGTGWIAGDHIALLQRLGGTQLVAVAVRAGALHELE